MSHRLSGLEQRVLGRLRALHLPPNAPILAGLSGGADSLALIALLRRLEPLTGHTVSAVHIDHGLRPESADEAVVARRAAIALDIPFYSERLAADPRQRHAGVGVEEAARRERYRVLARRAAFLGAPIVVVAHHQQDQAETLLLHLLRGGGLAGAQGMGEDVPLTVPWWTSAHEEMSWSGRLWRPFLQEPIHTVRVYARQLGLPIVEDPSNVGDELRRNAVRHHVVPLLEEISPGATAALARHARLIAADEAFLDDSVHAMLPDAMDRNGDLSAPFLLAQPMSLQRRLVRHWLERGESLPGVTADRTDAIVDCARRGVGGRGVEIGEGHIVLVVGARLVVGVPAQLRAQAAKDFGGPLLAVDARDAVRELSIPGSTTFGHFHVAVDSVELPSNPPAVVRTTTSCGFRHDGPTLVIRRPRRGDTWAVSRRTLSRWIARQRVSSLIRGELICFASNGTVHWIAGLPLPQFERMDESHGSWVIATVRREDGQCS